jgi:hypothetical protein
MPDTQACLHWLVECEFTFGWGNFALSCGLFRRRHVPGLGDVPV